MTRERNILPVIALRGLVVLPEKIMHVDLSRKQSITALDEAMKADKKIFFVTQRSMEVNHPKQEDLYSYGCVAEVKQVIKLPKNITRVLVTGETRGELLELLDEDRYLKGELDLLVETKEEVEQEVSIEDKAKIKALKDIYEMYIMVTHIKKDVMNQIVDIHDLSHLVNKVSSYCIFDYPNLQEILEADDIETRYDILAKRLSLETEIYEIKEQIHEKVKVNMDKSQKEFYLREEMKVIKKELGENTIEIETEEFLNKLNGLNTSKEVQEKLEKEIKRFSNLQVNSAEHGVVRTYIETMLEMPWGKKTEDSIDIKKAKEHLEAEHYGLDEVKERILEYLAVKSLTEKGYSPILCLVGPPGTGKTSIARSLATAMNKSYVRISLGGIHDEAEIRGHRKTYIGAMPGRIANAMKQAGNENPLMLLDEIDKVGSGNKGDTYSALLEVLDGEQNVKFRDHYLEVPLDLSDVLFVATANSTQTIPRPLLDRMELIEVNSYTENEKVHIANRHLIPKQLKAHGLTEKELTFSKAVLVKMSKNYTKEAGVRQLERKIGSVCRKVAKELVETNKKKVRVTESNMIKYLGQEKFRYKMRNDEDGIGVVRGLAWTSAGGDTLQIEAIAMPGKGSVILTGQLGNVMKESATAAISYIRSIAPEYEISDTYFLKHDIHIHIPDGAVPKDGPSAGITMALAILSAASGKYVKADLAMTGELTLSGRVLPIGGLKEKLLAAKNAGISKVLIPIDNKKNIEEISTEITDGMEIIPVAHMTEVCKEAFAK